MHSKVITCSSECSREHRRRLNVASTRAAYQRQKETQTAQA